MKRNVFGSNTSRPVPPSNAGSALLNWISDTSLRLLQLERRIDPWIRPAFDAVLRDPIARLTTALINWRRPNEGLKIAEERVQPDEEASLQSIIDTFQQQMRGLWRIKHPGLKDLAVRAATLLASFPERGIRHVPRAENAHADALANRGVDSATWDGSDGALPSSRPPA